MKYKNFIAAQLDKHIAGKGTLILWAIGVSLTVLLVIFISYELSPVLNYNRWDNFEYHTPTLLETHKQWLRGILPLWNAHQHMGEPLLANGQPSVFYFPYTIIAEFMALFNIAESNFTLIVILTHLPLMALGFYLLTQTLGVRRRLSWATSISITFSGYITVISTVWVFIVPIFTWLPFALLGVLLLFNNKSSRKGAVILATSMAILGYVGHPQFIAYSWLTIILFAFIYMMYEKNFHKLPILLLSFLSAAFLSAPSIIPVIRLLPNTSRNISFSREAFLSYGALPQALWGLISPAFVANNGFIVSGVSIMFFAGAWLLPALVFGTIVLFLKKRRKTSGYSHLAAGFAALSITGTLLLLFSLGQWGWLYGLTYGLPIWSSFRWPHKFIPFAMVSLAMAGALGLESYLRNPCIISRWIQISITVLLLAVVVTGLCAIGLAQNISNFALLTFTASVSAALITVWSGRKWCFSLLLIATFVSAIGVVTITQSLNLKNYSEFYGSVDAKTLGINNSYRVMPLSHHQWLPALPSAMQEHGLFQSATANNYYSLTGCTTAFIPQWYSRYIPSNVIGLVAPSSYQTLLTGPFLSSLNVRYYIVAKENTELITSLNLSPRYRRIKELSRVYVYERGDALGRAFFAHQTVKFNENDFLSWMSSYFETPHKAYVEGLSGTIWPAGSFVSEIKDDNSQIEVKLDAPDGGFLVLAYTWYPTWRAFVDGKETKIYRVNGTIQGVIIPRGAKSVVLKWSKKNVLIGIGLMIMGIFLLIGIIRIPLRK